MSSIGNITRAVVMILPVVVFAGETGNARGHYDWLK